MIKNNYLIKMTDTYMNPMYETYDDIKIGRLSVITGPMFSGKCVQKGTPILMYNGYIKNVEEILVGDQLMGDDSKPRQVLSTTHGFGPLYKVTSTFGDSYVVNEKHILTLKCKNLHNMTQTIIDIPIQDFMNQSESFKSHYKGFRVGVEFSNQNVPLDPYILGIWLGGGYTKETINDLEIWDILTNLNVINYKQIPHIYLSNSKENRLQLLAGLIDIKGHWDIEGQVYEIIQKNELFATQIIFLVRSLGMFSNLNTIEKTYIYNGKHQKELNYRVRIYGSNLVQIPCRIECKPQHIHHNDLSVGITIQPHGEGEYYGFTLDGNGRFLLGDFTVTHNSTELQRQIKRHELAGKNCLVIKHASDTRYDKPNDCCTHDLRTIPAIPVKCLWEIKEKCNDYDVTGIDEGQFFSEIVDFVDYLVEKLGKIVIVAALDGTFEGKPFGHIHELLSRSEQFIKLNAVCRSCGNDACFTIRRPCFIDKQDIIEVVGTDDLYESVCRKCRTYRNLRNLKK